MSTDRDQQHPQQKNDRSILDNLLREGCKDYNLAELARLRIRYRNFPGAKDIQTDLEELMSKWQLTEEELYEKTRQLHSQGKVYRDRSPDSSKNDWNATMPKGDRDNEKEQDDWS